MTSLFRSVAVALATGLAVLTTAGPASAHQEWFVNDPDAYPVDTPELLRPWVLIGVAVAIALTVSLRLLATRLPMPELGFVRPSQGLAGLVPWVPRLLAAHLGLSLLLLAFDRAVLDPGISAPDDAIGTVMLVPQAVVGTLLIAGVLVRPAAVAVIFAGPLAVLLHSPESLATLSVLLGIAVFLALMPPRLANGGRLDFDLTVLRWATLALKLGAGVTLISLALVEKLANPAMAGAMLEQTPAFGALALLGVSTDGFAVFTGSVELLLGLLVISGALPQVVALIAAVPFTATVALFGSTELVGHLPVYGVLLTLLILGSREDTSRVVSGLRLAPSKRRTGPQSAGPHGTHAKRCRAPRPRFALSSTLCRRCGVEEVAFETTHALELAKHRPVQFGS